MASSLNPPLLILGYRKGCLTAYGEVGQASSFTPEFLEVDIFWWSSILRRGLVDGLITPITLSQD